MTSFKKFTALSEAHQDNTRQQKLAVFTFGRMNPPTKGHQRLFDVVLKVREQRGGDAFVFPSKTHDSKKNPLPFETKKRFLQVLFPNIPFDFTETIKHPFDATGYLGSLGYTDLVMVVGSDRVDEFRRRFNRAYEYFDAFDVVNAGMRDPDDTGVSGMSASKAREAAVEGNIGKFRAATGWEGTIAEYLMRAVRDGMEKT